MSRREIEINVEFEFEFGMQWAGSITQREVEDGEIERSIRKRVRKDIKRRQAQREERRYKQPKGK